MQLNDEDVRQLVESIWATTVDMVMEACPVPEVDRERDQMSGTIHITGGWNGAIRVDCTERLAREACSRMFEQTPEETSEEEVCDTLSELTNMTGGNIKAILAELSEGDCRLSLPSVTAGRAFKVKHPGAEQILQLGFTCAGEPLTVTVVQEPATGRK